MTSLMNVADRIWAVADTHGDRLALWAHGVSLSYRELTDLAARTAASLLDAGVIPGDRVAILANRSIVAYAGILAALRAGCVYVPMNPRFPLERNRNILEASGATAIIIDEPNAVRFSSLIKDPPPPLRVVTMLEGAVTERVAPSDVARARARTAWPSRGADDGCYLIFTSGSTGKPKGVPIRHGNLCAYLDGILALAPLTAQDRFAQLSDLTFDLSVQEMFTTWTTGASLFSAPDGAKLAIADFVVEHAITCLLSVPSTAALARNGNTLTPGVMPLLRLTFFAGEALPGPVAKAWATAAPRSAIYNVYGPTEATVECSWYRFDPSAAEPPAFVPIGRALGEQRLMAIDANQRPISIGETGELMLGGSQVMDGYWQAPEIDAQKFVVIDGERWYRSGDLVRLTAEDGFHYLGRTDHQVKILGYRVELLEIEGELRRATGCDQVAVIAWPSTVEGGAQGTVAFLVSESLDDAKVFEALRARVPPYMIPHRLICVELLPQTVTGKTDHDALRSHRSLAVPLRAIGSNETTILALCAEILRVPGLRLTDGWVESGGDSLAAVVVVALARTMDGLEIPMNAFGGRATIADLARSAISHAAVDEISRTIAGPYRPLRWQAFYVDAGRRAERPGMWTGVQAITFEGPCDPSHMRLAVHDLIERHDALRSHAVPGPDGTTWFAPMIEWSTPWSERDVSNLAPVDAEAAWAELCKAELHRGFDLDRGPLVRFTLWRFDDRQHRLAISAHHSITDHHSSAIRFDDLMRAYDARRLHESVRYAARAPTLQAFAEWVHQQPRDALDAYYERMANGLDEVGTGLTAPHVPGGWLPRTLSSTVTLETPEITKARAFALRHGVTISSLLHGVWALVVARASGRSDIFFSTFLAGRRCPFVRVDLVVGGLALMAPVRVRSSAEAPAVAMVIETHKQLDHLSTVEWLIDPMCSPAPPLRGDAPVDEPGWPVTEPPFRQLRAATFFSIETARPKRALGSLRVSHESYAGIGQDCRELVATLYAGDDWRMVVTGSPRRFSAERVQWMAATFGAMLADLESLERSSLGELLSSVF